MPKELEDLQQEFKIFKEETAALARRHGYMPEFVGVVEARVQARMGALRALRGMLKAPVIPIVHSLKDLRYKPGKK